MEKHCTKLLKSGSRKGLVCDKLCTDNKDVCYYHCLQEYNQRMKEFRKQEMQKQDEIAKERQKKILVAPPCDVNSYHQELGMFVHEIIAELIEARAEIENHTHSIYFY